MLHSEKPFDLVYSRSLPYDAHIAGYWISRKLDLPWIANINDPFDRHWFPGNEHQGSLLGRINARFWFSEVTRHASLVTYPSRRLGDFHARVRSHKFAVLPHIGWQGQDDGTAGSSFTLLHAGKLGVSEMTNRSARPVLDALACMLRLYPTAARDFRLVFVGPKDESTEAYAAKVGLKEQVGFVGPVNYEQSLSWIAKASACLLVENCDDEGIYLPSKLADYLSARKPVFALSPAEGVVNDLTQMGGIRRYAPADVKAFAEGLGSCYQAWQKNSLHEWQPTDRTASQFCAKTIAMAFLSLAETAINGYRSN